MKLYNRPEMAAGFHTVARVGDLEPGDIVPVSAGGVEMILYRDGDRYYAAQRRCLHQGHDLSEGILSRGFLVCALHGWRYHLDTGVHEMSPINCLAVFRVRIDGDDIQVDPTPIRNGEIPQ